MERILLLALSLLSSAAFANSNCELSMKGTADTLNSYRASVVQCLNRQESGLAGTFDRLVDEYARLCEKHCTREITSYCQQAMTAKNNLKAASPTECTY